MQRPALALAGAILLAHLAVGSVHLVRSIGGIGDMVELSLSRPAGILGQSPWLRSLGEPVAFLRRTTPPTASLAIRSCQLSLPQQLGLPFVLYPRSVTVGTAPLAPGRGAAWIDACPSAWDGPASPAGDLALGARPRPFTLLGARVRGGAPSAVEAWRSAPGEILLASAPVHGGRAIFRRSLAVVGDGVLLRATGGAGAAVAIDPIVLPGVRRGHLRFRAGALVASSEALLAVPEPDPAPGAAVRGMLAIPLVVALGLAAVRLVPFAAGWGLRLGLAWGAGLGILAVPDLLLGLCGVAPWMRLGIVVVAAAASAALLPARWMPVGPPEEAGRGRRAAAMALGVLLALAIAMSALAAFLFPRDRFDSFAFWGIKTRAIWEEGRLTRRFLDRPYPHQDYPVLGPLVEAWVYRIAGGPCDRAAALLGPATLAAACMATWGALARHLPRPWPLAVAAGLALTPRVSHEAAGSLMDVHVAGLALLGVVALDLSAAGIRGAFLAGALLGLAGFAKNDGMPWLAAALAASLVAGWTSRRAAPAAAVALGGALVLLPWIALRVAWGLSTDIVNAEAAAAWSLGGGAAQIPSVIAGLIPYALSRSGPGLAGYDLAWALAAAGVAAAIVRRRRDASLATLLLAGLLVLGVYVLLPSRRLPDYLRSTGHRIVLQLLPAAAYAGARGMGSRP